MTGLDVRIIRLEPMRVASSLGYGPAPEGEAWTRLWTWIEAQGLRSQAASQRFFGFNNPNPSPGSPNYGYEQWVTVEEGALPGQDVQIKEFPGGLFAVARCQGVDHIFPTWQQLVAWHADSPYQHASDQCLEECLTPELLAPGAVRPDYSRLVFDLYLPIAE